MFSSFSSSFNICTNFVIQADIPNGMSAKVIMRPLCLTYIYLICIWLGK